MEEGMLFVQSIGRGQFLRLMRAGIVVFVVVVGGGGGGGGGGGDFGSKLFSK